MFERVWGETAVAGRVEDSGQLLELLHVPEGAVQHVLVLLTAAAQLEARDVATDVQQLAR